jgi:hypothetical protein
MPNFAIDQPLDDAAAPPPKWWAALVAGLGALALLGSFVMGGSALSDWRERAALERLANAPTDEWVAASDARPSGSQLALAAAGRLELAARRASRTEARRLLAEAARLYERVATLEPFNGLAKLRLAKTLLRSAPDDGARGPAADRARELIAAAFATSPSEPAVADEALELLVVWIGDMKAAAELSRRMLAANHAFVARLSDIAFEGNVPVEILYRDFLPPAEGVVDASGRPSTLPSLLAEQYLRKLWLPELAALTEASLDAKTAEDLRPAAPAIVELLHEDATTEALGRKLWTQLHGALSPEWPGENAIFLGDPERDAPEGGYAWRIETRESFFHRWNPAPYVADFYIKPESESISLGRHPNLQRGLARLSQRLPKLEPGRYRLEFLQSLSNRAMAKSLTVGLKGRDRRGKDYLREEQPHLSAEWSRVELQFDAPQGLDRGEIYFLLDPRNLPPSVKPETCSLCRFRLTRVGDVPAPTAAGAMPGS